MCIRDSRYIYRSALWSLCYGNAVLSVLFVTLAYCGQQVAWIRMPLRARVGLGPDDIVWDGDPAPRTEKGTAVPHFSAHVYCGETVAHLKPSPISSTSELLYFIVCSCMYYSRTSVRYSYKLYLHVCNFLWLSGTFMRSWTMVTTHQVTLILTTYINARINTL